uniref:Uncharacterized protein n=1 Tax=Knipowitschia caucasica TaxID=637954 RepID=A0AAV2JLA0_KNICA
MSLRFLQLHKQKTEKEKARATHVEDGKNRKLLDRKAGACHSASDRHGGCGNTGQGHPGSPWPNTGVFYGFISPESPPLGADWHMNGEIMSEQEMDP